MANVETRRDESTFLGSCKLVQHRRTHVFYERRLDYKSILSRSGHAVAHDEEAGAKGIRMVGQKGWAKSPGRQIWRTGSSRGLSFQGRVGNVAGLRPLCLSAFETPARGPGEPPGPRTSRAISFSWTCQESSEIPPHYRSGGLIS